jgi:hypothetical protein
MQRSFLAKPCWVLCAVASGLRGVVDAADVASGKVKVIAPEGFMQAAIEENVFRLRRVLRPQDLWL